MLIVGLGNPGEKYAQTRHNVGFMALDELVSKLELSGWENKHSSQIIKAKNQILAKPETFMNNSGVAVKEISQFYQIPVDEIVVAHDDVDLPFGEIKVKQGGSSAGHHGIESIDQTIGSEYWRVRVGVGRPEQREVSDYVLAPFTAQEQVELPKIIDQTAEQLVQLLKNND